MGERSPGKMKLLLVGIDAACSSVLDPMLDDGELETLGGIFETGVYGELESQIPPWTASAWPSIYTGVNPGKHGVFSFLDFDGYDWTLVNRTTAREYAVWELLDRHGLSSVVVNVPVTHPPRPFDGALIPGFVAPDEPKCHPPGILEEVRDAIGGYEVYRAVPWDQLSRTELVEYYERLVRMRGDAFRYLCERFPPDFGFIQFQQTDSVFHELPDDDEAARAVYQAVDAEVRKIIDQFEPENVLLVSDHGIGPYGGYEFRVNEFLREHGYVETTTKGRGMPSWTALRQAQRGVDSTPTPAKRVLRGGVNAAAAVGITSQRVKTVVDRLELTPLVLRYVPNDVLRAGTEQVDFENSRAYIRARTELGVVVNAAGKYPHGTVPEEEYEQTRDELIELLQNVRTPDGDPVFERVGRREEFFEGPSVDDVADVIAVPTAFDHLATATLDGDVFTQLSDLWEHKQYGVVGAMGTEIDAEMGVGDAHIFDITPTVLGVFGVPRSERMDGQTLPFITDSDTETLPAFDPTPRERTTNELVEGRLTDLGYLE